MDTKVEPKVLCGRFAERLIGPMVGAEATVRIKKKGVGWEIIQILTLHQLPLVLPETITGPITRKMKWFNKIRGYGFVQGIADGYELFLHVDLIKRCGIDPDRLVEGTDVVVSYGTNSNNGKLTVTDIALAPEPAKV